MYGGQAALYEALTDRLKRVLRYHSENAICLDENSITLRIRGFRLFPENISVIRKEYLDILDYMSTAF
jgi:hypothetical protein